MAVSPARMSMDPETDAGVREVVFGFLWNMPNYGAVAFDENETVWRAHDADQVKLYSVVRVHGV
jgi:hypothetical protein